MKDNFWLQLCIFLKYFIGMIFLCTTVIILAIFMVDSFMTVNSTDFLLYAVAIWYLIQEIKKMARGMK